MPVIWPTGLSHTQGIQGNSVNFQILENVKEIQGISIFVLNLEKLKEVLFFSKNFREIL